MDENWTWAVTTKNILFMGANKHNSIPQYSLVKFHHNSIGQAEYKGHCYAFGDNKDDLQFMSSRKDGLTAVKLARLLYG